MKKAAFLTFILALTLAVGCRTKYGGRSQSSYIQAPGAQTLNQAEGFKVGQVEDLSGFQFRPNDQDAFSLKEAMSAALADALASEGLTGEGRNKVNVNILAYNPGNVFVRWILLPGTGDTTLTVEATIVDKKGAQLANIPVDRRIFNGFTIGAYKYIFEEVAQEITEVIKDPTKTSGRKPGQAGASRNAY